MIIILNLPNPKQFKDTLFTKQNDLIYWEETQNGSSLISEARFSGGKRADLFNISNNTALEIIHSEGKESIERKKEEYPCKVIFLEADKVINYWLDKLSNKELK